MAQAGDQELVDRFDTFYRRSSSDRIADRARKYPREEKSLEVDWQDLFRFDPDFADEFLEMPRRFTNAAEEALQLYDLPVDVTLSDAHVRVFNLPTVTEIRDIRSEHLGSLISVRGIVRKATSVKPKIEQAAFECLRCGTLTVVPQSDGGFQDPYKCSGCEREGPFQFLTESKETEFIDAQNIRVQESPEGLGGGETPESIDMHIEDDITGEVSPGDHVIATGILQLDDSEIESSDTRVFDVYIEGISVEVEDEEFEEMEITDEEKQEIVRLSDQPNVYEQIIESIAPTIYGYDVAKLAIALQLFSGVTKHLPDGARIRGDLHILLVGDPGTGKCVRGDTMVTLADGTRATMRDLVESNLADPKPIDDGVFDETAFEVLSLSPDGSIEPATATKVWKREAPAEMYRVTLADGSTLEITPSHPLFTVDGSAPEAVPAEELEEGRFVAVPRKTNANEAFAEIPTKSRPDVIPEIGPALKRIRRALGLRRAQCGVPRTTYQHYERGDRNPSRESLRTVLSTFRDRLAELEEAKARLSDAEWADIEQLRTDLGLSQTDLADEIGVEQTTVSMYSRGEVAPDGGRVRDASEALEDRIDSALAVSSAVNELSRLVDGDLAWSQITDIERVDPDYGWVYDLEVEGTHSYLSNNVLSHNSQILQYIRNIAPRSVYTSGKGSSSAGLTAAAVRDDFGDGQQWSLEAGALVLADKGVAAIDELDKMAPDDRSAMHEALEQQSYHPSSEILLADGRRVQIGDFVDDQMADRRDEVVDGVNCEILPIDDAAVHSTDLESNETTKLPVDRVSRHEAPDEFVRVSFSNGRSVLVTPEHPMFVDDGGEISTVEARTIEEDAFVPVPRKLPNSSAPVELSDEAHIGKERDVELPDDLSPVLAEILGFLVAEGHSYAGSSHEIGFSNQDERLLDRMDRLMVDVFGLQSTDTTNEHGTVTKRWVSTKLYRWFERNFPAVMGTARDKRIPAPVLGASEEHIRRFLVGAFAGDGGVESEAMALSTASPGLAEDYADALSKIGVGSRIHYNSTEDSWKTYVMGDSTERFVEAVVEPADERHERARAFVERSNETLRHHDVLPTSAAHEIRSLRRLVGLSLTGEFKPNLDEGYGVQVENVKRHSETLRDRLADVHLALEAAETLGDVRSAIDWSGRQLAERLAGETASAIHYAESGGYDESRRSVLAERARETVEEALLAAERRLDDLESRLDLRFYRVRDIETVPNEGEYETDWVYDVTVEPTNTFVSQGVILHNSISISKAGINATLKSRCALLGAANPELGRFDRYETPAEQIDLEPALISRFDLIFTVTDQPDEEKDDNLASHILRTNYAGELHTQRERVSTSTVSEEDVDEATRSVSPTIRPDILRKYVAYARSTCFPTMTDAAEQRIREFYVDLRSEGTGEDSPVPVTARKLEAIVRLAEASARIRLSDTVEIEDAERALEIVETTLKEIGMDPETGRYDADVIETGRSKSQRDRVRTIRQLIGDIESEFDEGAPIEEVLARAEELDMDRSRAEHEIEKLKKQGEVYEPTTDHLRTT